MLRFAIAFAAAGAAVSANASSIIEQPPNAHAVIDGAFAAIAAASPTPAFMHAPVAVLVSAPADKAAVLAFAPQDKAATAFAMVPAKASLSTSVTPASAPATPPSANIVITVDKSTQRMKVVVNGVQRWVWPVSTGRRGYATPGGTYRAFRMVRDHKSREW